MKPSLSVIIPAYQAARYLPQAVASVHAQGWDGPLELIVVDDGSTDGTGQLARSLGAQVLETPHQGVSAARNAALAQARGRFIAFLDADDLWAPEKLERQMAYLSAHPDCQIVFTEAENFFDGGGPMTPRQQVLLKDRLERYLPSACIRRELLETVGPFREDLIWGEDTEWVLRLGMAGVDLTHCLPEVLYRRRIHNSNLTLTHDPSSTFKDLLPVMAQAIRRAQKGKKTP